MYLENFVRNIKKLLRNPTLRVSRHTLGRLQIFTPALCTSYFLTMKIDNILNLYVSGALPSRREHSGERAHREQLQPVGEADQGVGAPVRRHLPLLHRAVQVHRRRGRERVSNPSLSHTSSLHTPL